MTYWTESAHITRMEINAHAEREARGMNSNVYGWGYPPGAEHDPNAPWNLPDMPESCEKCGEDFLGDWDQVEATCGDTDGREWTEIHCLECVGEFRCFECLEIYPIEDESSAPGVCCDCEDE